MDQSDWRRGHGERCGHPLGAGLLPRSRVRSHRSANSVEAADRLDSVTGHGGSELGVSRRVRTHAHVRVMRYEGMARICTALGGWCPGEICDRQGCIVARYSPRELTRFRQRQERRAEFQAAKLEAREPQAQRHKRPRCGARTRTGKPCQAPVVWDHQLDRPKNGRCKLHGGLSTGPKTLQGQHRSLAALQRGHSEWLARKENDERPFER